MSEKREKFDLGSLIKPVDLFASTDPNQPELLHNLSLLDLYPFKEHPFKAYSEEKMAEMVQSVEKNGVFFPILVRPNPYGNGYEIISGHNRVEASRRCKLSTIQAIVKDLDDDQATILMVDSNFQQREKLHPSEKAFGYKMKLEAMKRQAGRPEKNSGQIVLNLKGRQSREILADLEGVNYKQIQRYIRLTYLTHDLLDYVDGEQMAIGPAVHLSFLPAVEQNIVREVMEREQVFPSIQQAQRLKRLSTDGHLDWSAVNAILTEAKPEQKIVNIRGDRFAKFFPKNLTPQELEDNIYKILDHWYRNRNHNKDR